MSYLIGTGWWCDGTGKQMGAGRNESTDEIRQESFFYLWNRFVLKFTDPECINVVDSASPVKPKIEYQRNSEKFIWDELANNPGHGKGWLKSVVDSAKEALVQKLDYVYIEQDCLVYGENWVDECLKCAKRNTGILLGDGTGTPQPLQQSLIVVIYEKLQAFINGIAKYKGDDGISNENMFNDNLNWNALPMYGGRVRPIDFNKEYWYAQHFTAEELKTAVSKLDEVCVDTE